MKAENLLHKRQKQVLAHKKALGEQCAIFKNKSKITQMMVQRLESEMSVMKTVKIFVQGLARKGRELEDTRGTYVAEFSLRVYRAQDSWGKTQNCAQLYILGDTLQKLGSMRALQDHVI